MGAAPPADCRGAATHQLELLDEPTKAVRLLLDVLGRGVVGAWRERLGLLGDLRPGRGAPLSRATPAAGLSLGGARAASSQTDGEGSGGGGGGLCLVGQGDGADRGPGRCGGGSSGEGGRRRVGGRAMAAERPTARMHRERAQGAAASARLGPLLHGDGGLRTADGHRAGRHEGRRGREAGGEEQRAHHRAAEVI